MYIFDMKYLTNITVKKIPKTNNMHNKTKQIVMKYGQRNVVKKNVDDRNVNMEQKIS